MMFRGFLRMLFAANPKPGEKYILDDNDPFDTHTAKVLEVKQGWVRYRRFYRDVSREYKDTFADFKLFWKRVEG